MPDGPATENDQQREKQQSAPPPPPAPRKEQGKGGDQNNPQANDQTAGQQPPPPPVSRRWQFWSFFSKSEWVMVFLTAVIAGTGVVGIVLIIQGGSDTQKMIKAAQQQACSAQKSAKAAQDFAATAALINGNINNAVGKLNTQASAAITALQKTDILIDQTKNANKIARDALETSSRPWVGIEKDLEISNFKFVSQRADGQWEISYSGKIQVKNFGQTPALRVGLEVTAISILPIRKTLNDEIDWAKRLSCIEAETETGGFSSGEYLFPGKVLTKSWNHVPYFDLHISPSTLPMFFGCIAYTDSFGNTCHTRFAYQMEASDNSKPLTLWPMNQTVDCQEPQRAAKTARKQIRTLPGFARPLFYLAAILKLSFVQFVLS